MTIKKKMQSFNSWLPFIVLFFAYSPLFGQEAQTLSFQKLKELDNHTVASIKDTLSSYQNKPVLIRGFLYTHDKKWILSPEPRLSTCCVGAAHNVKKQIEVAGGITDPKKNFPVAVQGLFAIKPRYDKDGVLISLYRLDNASVLQTNDRKKEKNSKWLVLGILGAGFLFYIKKKSNSQRRPR